MKTNPKIRFRLTPTSPIGQNYTSIQEVSNKQLIQRNHIMYSKYFSLSKGIFLFIIRCSEINLVVETFIFPFIFMLINTIDKKGLL